MTDNLRCPFCGHESYADEETFRNFGKRTGHEFAIACSGCEVSSPGAHTLQAAWDQWNTRAALAAAPQPVRDREACRAKQAEPDRGSDETPYDRGYVWGYRHGLRDGKAEVAPQPAPAETFQNRVEPWMTACFGPEISGDRMERADRLLEEVLELLQSGDYPRERIAALTGYVWSRPKGEPAQEVGGVMVTLAAYCLAHSLDMHEAGETELARIWTKIEKIRAKQAAKPAGSALPQVWPEQPAPVDRGEDEKS